MSKYLRRAVVLGVLCLSAACSGDANERKQAYLESGQRYAQEKKFAEAIIEYRNAVALDPQFGEAHYQLSEALIESGDVPGAAAELIRAADLMPARADVQLQAGSVLLLAGQFDDARLQAEKVLGTDSTNVLAQILKANALAGLKDFQRALDEVQAAVALDPQRSGSYTALGTVQQARGELQEAEAAFKRAVELAPTSPSAHLAVGNFYWTSNRIGDAEAAFKEARRLEPDNPLANRALATFYLASNRAAEAEPFLLVLAGRDRGDRLALADYYVMLKRYDEALKNLSPGVGETGSTGDTRTRIAAVKYLQGKRDEAHRELDGLLGESNPPAIAYLTKARFLVSENKAADALPLAEHAVSANPRDINSLYLLGVLNGSLKRLPEARQAFTKVLELNPRAVAAQVHMADLELASGNAAASAQHAQDAVLAQPQNAAARLLLARAYLAENNMTGAERELNVLLKSFPTWAALHGQLGLFYTRRQDSEKARKAFETALTLDPKSPEAVAGLVALDMKAGRADDARARVEARVSELPQDVGTLLMAARSYILMKDYAKAEGLLKDVLVKAPTELRAYSDLAQLYIVMGKLEDAKRGLEELGRREPKVAPAAETMVGVILQVQNREEEAVKKYEQVLVLEQRSPVAANNLAWIYAERGQNLETALQLALSARNLMPDEPAVSDTLGYVYLKRSSPDLAVPVLRQAVQKEPGNVRYRLRLGIALAKAGQVSEARRELTEALRGNPNVPESAEARGALNGLPSQTGQ